MVQVLVVDGRECEEKKEMESRLKEKEESCCMIMCPATTLHFHQHSHKWQKEHSAVCVFVAEKEAEGKKNEMTERKST